MKCCHYYDSTSFWYTKPCLPLGKEDQVRKVEICIAVLTDQCLIYLPACSIHFSDELIQMKFFEFSDKWQKIQSNNINVKNVLQLQALDLTVKVCMLPVSTTGQDRLVGKESDLLFEFKK